MEQLKSKPSIGERIRVTLESSIQSSNQLKKKKKPQRKSGMVATEMDENGKVEVILDRSPPFLSNYMNIENNKNKEEEISVHIDQVLPLLFFEYEKNDYDNKINLEELVLRNNKYAFELGKLRDYKAARSLLRKSIDWLCGDRISEGSLILEYFGQYDEHTARLPEVRGPGMVCTLEHNINKAEVLVDDEEIVMEINHMITIPTKIKYATLLVMILNTMSKYALQEEQPALSHALETSRIASKICRCLLNDNRRDNFIDEEDYSPEQIKDFLFDALMLETRVQVIQCRFKEASSHIREAIFLKPSHTGARDMVNIIKSYHKREKIKNKKLSKNIALWVQESLNVNKSLQNEQQDQTFESNTNNNSNNNDPGFFDWMKSNFGFQ